MLFNVLNLNFFLTVNRAVSFFLNRTFRIFTSILKSNKSDLIAFGLLWYTNKHYFIWNHFKLNTDKPIMSQLLKMFKPID